MVIKLSFIRWKSLETAKLTKKLVKNWPNICLKLDKNWSKIGLKLVKKWSKIGRKSVKNLSKIGQKSIKSWSEINQKSIKKIGQKFQNWPGSQSGKLDKSISCPFGHCLQTPFTSLTALTLYFVSSLNNFGLFFKTRSNFRNFPTGINWTWALFSSTANFIASLTES